MFGCVMRLSSIIKWGFLALIPFHILLDVFLWMNAPNDPHLYGFMRVEFFSKYVVMHEMSWFYKLGGIALTLSYSFFMLCIYFVLYRLFDVFSKGEYFSLRTIHWIKRVGLLFLLNVLFSPVFDAVLSFYLTFLNPEGVRTISISLAQQNVQDIFMGLIFFTIAGILREAMRYKTESDLTI